MQQELPVPLGYGYYNRSTRKPSYDSTNLDLMHPRRHSLPPPPPVSQDMPSRRLSISSVSSLSTMSAYDSNLSVDLLDEDFEIPSSPVKTRPLPPIPDFLPEQIPESPISGYNKSRDIAPWPPLHDMSLLPVAYDTRRRLSSNSYDSDGSQYSTDSRGLPLEYDDQFMEMTALDEPICDRKWKEMEKMVPDWAAYWKIEKTKIEQMGAKNVKRQNIIHEIIAKEVEFVNDMHTLSDLYPSTIRNNVNLGIGTIDADKLDKFLRVVFGNVQGILRAGKILVAGFQRLQEKSGPEVEGLGELLLAWSRDEDNVRHPYRSYSGGLVYAEKVVRDEAAKNPLFSYWLEKCRHDSRTRRLDLISFLEAPTRRMQRYLVHLKELANVTDPESYEYDLIKQSEASFRQLLSECDSRVEASEKRLQLIGLVFKGTQNGEIPPERKLIKRGLTLLSKMMA